MRKIQWTRNAIEDLKEIQDFISMDSECQAEKVIADILNQVESISRFPHMGRKVAEIDDDTIRELIVNNYRLVHRIEENEIIVLSIVHGRQDFKMMIDTSNY